MTDELQEVPCVFVGVRMTSDGKLSEGYVTLEKATALADEDWDTFEDAVSLFSPSKTRGRQAGVVGGIYTMKVKLVDGRIGSAIVGSRDYTGRFPDTAALTAWEVRDEAAKMQQRKQRVIRKAKESSFVEGELVALRALYTQTPYADRMAFELMVLERLRRA